MTIKELLINYKDVELTKEQEKQIKEYLNIKENKKWRPEKEELFYFITSLGEIQQDTTENTNNNFKIFTNNCFKTKEEAEFRLEQIKVYNELKNFADENNGEMNWRNFHQYKYFIYLNYGDECLSVSKYSSVQYQGTIYFTSEKLAEQAIKKVGADRIKKYLFGVE